MKFKLIILLLLAFTNFCTAQARIENFEKFYHADFNNDKITDVIRIEEVGCDYDKNDRNICRDVRVSSLKQDGTSSFSTYNDHIIPCSKCNEDLKDPFKKIIVRKKSFSFIMIYNIVPQGTKMINKLTFKYDKILHNFTLYKRITKTGFYKNGELNYKISRETLKDFGIIYFSDYR